MAITQTRLRNGNYSIVEKVVSDNGADPTTRSIVVTAAQAPDFFRRLKDVAKAALGFTSDDQLNGQALSAGQFLAAGSFNTTITDGGVPSFPIASDAALVMFEVATPPTNATFAFVVTASAEALLYEIRLQHSINQ
jgi:hypothetical protein